VARSPPDERPRGDRTTDEGWSKYFKDIGNTTLAGVEPARSTRSSQASNETKSDYRSSQWPSVPGIALGVLDEPHPLNRVQVGSPSTELFPSKEVGLLHQSQMAKISSADSLSIASEDDDQDPVDAFSSGVPASINDESSWLEGVSERPQSSNYTGSYYPPSLSHGIPDQSNNYMPGIDGRVPWRELDNKNQEHSQRLRRDNINSDMSWLNLNGG
jgi:crooked neck